MAVIEVEGLTKRFGERIALDHVDFQVKRGQIFSILGSNGAGKSTILNILCTLLKPDQGTVRINQLQIGRDDEKIRRKMGIIFQESLLDETLTVSENLMLRARFYHDRNEKMKRAYNRAVEITRISQIMNRYYGTLSGGEKRRVDIARALIQAPSLLCMDEPTTGLDPRIRKDIWDTIHELHNKEGMTVIYSTHYMEEVDAADYVIFMKQGKIISSGNPMDLLKSCGKDVLKLTVNRIDSTKQLLEHRQYRVKQKGDQLLVSVQSHKEAADILHAINEQLVSFEIEKVTMDDVFIKLTGGNENGSFSDMAKFKSIYPR